MKHYRYIALVLALVLFPSCEKTLNISDDMAHQPVLNGIMAADSTAFVYFAQTRFFLDSSTNQPVDGAVVTLTVNGMPLNPDSVVRCRYYFPHVLQGGDSLSVDVSSPMGQVHASTYVPLFPDVNNFGVSFLETESFNFYTVNFRLDDHASRNEYYVVNVMERDSGQRYDVWGDSLELVDTIHSTFFLVPYNPEITASDVQAYVPMGGYLYSRLMFTDTRIDGMQYPLSLYVIRTVDTNERAPFKHEYFVEVQSITPSRWNYIASASQQNSMTSFFTEQGEAWSNVDGALGVFAGTANRRFMFDVDTIAGVPLNSGR